MEQFSFDFGFGSIDDIFAKPVVPAEKAKTGAGNKKKQEKKEKKTPAKKYTLPLVVRSVYGEIAFDGEGEITDQEIFKKLVEEYHMPQFKLPIFGLKSMKNSTDLIICMDTMLTEPSSDTAVDIERTITICRGERVMELSVDMFEGLEQGEVSVADIRNRWIETYPEFADCKLAYDLDSNTAYPYWDKKWDIKENISLPVTIGDADVSLNYAPEDFNGAEEVPIKILVEKYLCTEFEDDSISLYVHKTEDESLIIDLATHGMSGKKNFVEKSVSTLEKGAKKRVMIPLPVKIAYSFKEPETVTSEQFEGKAKVPITEIQKYVSSKYKMYTKETSDFFYCEEEKVVIANLRSGKRG